MTEPSPTPDRLVKQIATGAKRSGSGTGRDLVCGNFDIRIARDGTWFYHGSPIARKPLVKLFSTVLKREDDGTYVLETPVEKGRIEVEDVPFIAVELTASGVGRDQVLTLRTNLDEIVTIDSEHPLRVDHDPESGEPRPYVLVRDRLEARLARPVYYQLVELGMERSADEANIYGVWSKGSFFPIGEL
jgi:hypothetical protein